MLLTGKYSSSGHHVNTLDIIPVFHTHGNETRNDYSNRKKEKEDFKPADIAVKAATGFFFPLISTLHFMFIHYRIY